MPFYRDTVYPHLVDLLGDPPPIEKVRRQIIPLAQGIVLEIGAGSGANFVHYDAARVNKLYALEPNPGMIRLAERQQRKTKLNIEFISLPGERIPLEDDSVDTMVSTFTFCCAAGVGRPRRDLKGPQISELLDFRPAPILATRAGLPVYIPRLEHR